MRRLAFFAAAGSALLLGGAYLFQLLGYAPCKMCLWQRWPHAVAILIGLAFALTRKPALLWIGATAAATTASIGAFHAGVEQGWWEGPSSCTGSGLEGLSGAELISTDGISSIVMCDEIAWQLFGLSMAGWNAALSLILAVIWVVAARSNVGATRG